MSGSTNDIYVSFIKINGKSILPPLLDKAKREEMRHYRDLAISVGLKIKERSKFEKNCEVNCLNEHLVTLEEHSEPLSPTLTASTDLNQFLDSTLDASPQPSSDANATLSSGRLVRSESYTLDQPSVSLLAAVEKEVTFNVKTCRALQVEKKRCDKPSRKVVILNKKKKLLASPRLSKKSQSAKIKQSVCGTSKLNHDDLHIDLDLHLDVPSGLIGPCLNNFESTAMQTIPTNHVATQINIPDDTNIFPLPLHQLEDTDGPDLISFNEECIDSSNVVFNESKMCQFTLLPDEVIEQIIEKDLISFESDAFEDEQPLTESYGVQKNMVQRSQSTPEFSRAATATQTDLSPISNDDSSHGLSDVEPCRPNGHREDLPTLVASIQSEYESKLNALMRQQEQEKQRLKEQFLQQQELLFQKLTISTQSYSPRSSLSHTQSPPIHHHREEKTPPKKPLSLELAQKFAKLPALVRGYLTRRLMRTERVQNIKSTIRETLSLAVHLHSQPPPLHPTDIALHGRLIQQLDQALAELHDVFFTLPLVKRLHLIAMDREKLQKGSSSARSSSGSRISSATLKAQQRRQQQLQRSSTSPQIGPGGDTTPVATRRSKHHDTRPHYHHSDNSAKQTNGDVMTKARRHSDRRASIPKSKQPWR